jgi:hypothetical protein
VNDALFTFEAYLMQSGYPRESWANYAMSLLERQALSTYISYAQPLARPITWEEFRACLCTAYARPDRELSARKTLFAGEIKHTSSVADYLRRFRQIVARCGKVPDSQSLRDLFWQNLKPNIRDKCRIDPLTGKYWDTFEALADHTVLFDSQSCDGQTPTPNHKGKFHHHKSAALKSVKTSNASHAQGRKHARSVSFQPGTSSDGHPSKKPGHNYKCNGLKDVKPLVMGGKCPAIYDHTTEKYSGHHEACKHNPKNKPPRE